LATTFATGFYVRLFVKSTMLFIKNKRPFVFQIKPPFKKTVKPPLHARTFGYLLPFAATKIERDESNI